MSKPKTLFAVVGVANDPGYDGDHQSWVSRIFSEKEDADNFAEFMNIEVQKWVYLIGLDRETIEKKLILHDKKFVAAYGNAEYTVEETLFETTYEIYKRELTLHEAQAILPCVATVTQCGVYPNNEETITVDVEYGKVDPAWKERLPFGSYTFYKNTLELKSAVLYSKRESKVRLWAAEINARHAAMEALRLFSEKNKEKVDG